jgi:hypothetical protein
MNETKRLFIENIKKTLWFSIKQDSVVILNNHILELSNEDKIEIEKTFTTKINNLIGSIIEYANSRDERSAVVEAKSELTRLMQLNLTISYSKEYTPILFERNIQNNNDIKHFIEKAYESEGCIS